MARIVNLAGILWNSLELGMKGSPLSFVFVDPKAKEMTGDGS
jgi:hypothetical protein